MDFHALSFFGFCLHLLLEMSKKLLLLLPWYLFCHAQVTWTGFEKNEDVQLQKIIQKKSEYHSFTNGRINGYRIKIYFGNSKEEAKGIKAKFQAKFPEVPAYDDYVLPNFIVVVGNFRTRMEARGFLKKIKIDFPSAFVVSDKIYPETP